jgi:hypothetical protein
MDTPRIQLGHPKGATPPNTYSDFDWVHLNKQALYEQYGACVALIIEKTMVGIGQTIQEAAETAERNLPPESGVITPILTFLHPPVVVFRGWPDNIKREKQSLSVAYGFVAIINSSSTLNFGE